ncbi:NAD(P)/FAD-dependent oxidoreductase [Advenella mimigardefordensis]|uniref:NADH dehydrogenase n=1 Tax=Advenella mimigardefordensis (strain DSM 17166 / LMG 22922 / DPN7) TaxID=1247726 RepID=W0PGZ5_ADVMD|nr:NAD(P)/FAD-dependent oxidoreductase [Advenella mimigardefordensis]AHG65746.1 NADH dehydrogenase [Advenella mimigardefordensis DPN7]
MPISEHKIIIVGGGAGGLELATKLGRKFGPKHIYLVDAGVFHIWKPSLHEVASGTLDIHREGLSYAMLAKDHGFTFVPGEVDGIDRDARTIHVKPVYNEGEEVFSARDLPYDTLVLAVGSRSNFFNTPGAEEYATALDSTEQAEKFRLKFLRELIAADQRKKTDSSQSLNIAIVGGGATGVELAAELLEAGKNLGFYGINELNPENDIHITLLEGSPRILAALPEKTSAAATKLLKQRGITVKTSVLVSSVQEKSLTDSNDNQYPADLTVWAAGIKAPAFLTTLGLETNKINQIIADKTLCTSDPAIYAMGDCAQVEWEDGRYLPARAQVAHQQADYLIGELSARIKGTQSSGKPFVFKDYGSLVSVGHNKGVGSLMGVLTGKSLFVEGLLARLMYMSLHLMHHMAILGIARTGSVALGRLLLKRSTPKVKLH